MPKFTFNDENVINSYGFVVKTAGISLKRFNANPVMLEQHWNSTTAVLGRWKNIKKEEALLTGEDEFDTDDPDALKIKGKVDRGFIKGCSMGIAFTRDDMKQRPDGVWELSKCELYEVSIVAIPSNANSLRLYAAESGELLSEEQVKLTLSTLQVPIEKPKNEMYKLNLTAATLMVLGLPNSENGIDLATAVEKLADRYNSEKNERANLQTKLDQISKEELSKLLDDAQLAGKITATTRPEFEEMGKTNLALVKKVIAGIPAKTSLAGQVVPPESNGGPKTEEDFHKMTLAQQLAWKAAYPAAYSQLFA